MRFVVAALSLAFVAAAAGTASANSNSFCASMSKAKQGVSTCKPFKDGVCDVANAPACSERLCDTLKADDGCGLATKADVDYVAEPIHGSWWLTINELTGSCTHEPLTPATDPSISVFCSRLDPDDWLYITRLCPPEAPLAVQGSCGVSIGVGDSETKWEIPNAGFNMDVTGVSCAFRPADLPAKLKAGRLYASATCARVKLAAAGAVGAAPETRVLNGVQIKA